MTSQRQDLYDPYAMQNDNVEKSDMMYPQDDDCVPYKQEYHTQMQEKPKTEKMWQTKKGIKIFLKEKYRE